METMLRFWFWVGQARSMYDWIRPNRCRECHLGGEEGGGHWCHSWDYGGGGKEPPATVSVVADGNRREKTRYQRSQVTKRIARTSQVNPSSEAGGGGDECPHTGTTECERPSALEAIIFPEVVDVPKLVQEHHDNSFWMSQKENIQQTAPLSHLSKGQLSWLIDTG